MDRASTEIYTLSLHDALPIYGLGSIQSLNLRLLINAENHGLIRRMQVQADNIADLFNEERMGRDRKSTRLNSSHTVISYAVFCLKKKKKKVKNILAAQDTVMA